VGRGGQEAKPYKAHKEAFQVDTIYRAFFEIHGILPHEVRAMTLPDLRALVESKKAKGTPYKEVCRKLRDQRAAKERG